MYILPHFILVPLVSSSQFYFLYSNGLKFLSILFIVVGQAMFHKGQKVLVVQITEVEPWDSGDQKKKNKWIFS